MISQSLFPVNQLQIKISLIIHYNPLSFFKLQFITLL